MANGTNSNPSKENAPNVNLNNHNPPTQFQGLLTPTTLNRTSPISVAFHLFDSDFPSGPDLQEHGNNDRIITGIG